MPIKEKLILMQHLLIFLDFLHFKKKLHVAESKLEISCNIIDDFRQQYELALDEIYDLQGEIVILQLQRDLSDRQKYRQSNSTI
jgi:hypothetical protein